MSGTVKKFDYKIIDPEGHETLSAIAQADNFNNWMYNTIKPYCKGKILEIGSGVGNISQFFIEDKVEILLTDIRDNYCEALREKFSNKANLLGVENIDIVDKDFETRYAKYIGTFDTVFALNVIEHIENDKLAIANCKKLLAKGGNLIILVPAYQWLYNNFDKELYHFRRYLAKQMRSLFVANDITVKRSFNFNALGIVGWFTSGKFLKKKIIPPSQMRFYNIIVPIARLLDALVLRKMGLSAIVIGEKK
jgi:2-polyprenyl-3-methyl-5-hydroxy-6-metoxy-1,4-benzoquinol methylase